MKRNKWTVQVSNYTLTHSQSCITVRFCVFNVKLTRCNAHCVSMQATLKYVLSCRRHVRPLMAFLEQLVKWEDQVLGETFTNIANL